MKTINRFPSYLYVSLGMVGLTAPPKIVHTITALRSHAAFDVIHLSALPYHKFSAFPAPASGPPVDIIPPESKIFSKEVFVAIDAHVATRISVFLGDRGRFVPLALETHGRMVTFCRSSRSVGEYRVNTNTLIPFALRPNLLHIVWMHQIKWPLAVKLTYSACVWDDAKHQSPHQFHLLFIEIVNTVRLRN